jgi:hypothetical protein
MKAKLQRTGADKWLLALFPFIFIAVVTAFATLVWGANTFLVPLFS